MKTTWKVTVDLGTSTKIGVIISEDIDHAEHKFLDQLADQGYTEADFVEVTTERTYERPTQPYEHESKCPCYECEEWAIALLDWEQAEVKAGRNPWANL